MLSLKRMREKLIDYEEMAAESGLPVRFLRGLVYQKKIPVVVLGHRTIRFQPSRVFEALQRFEVREATARK